MLLLPSVQVCGKYLCPIHCVLLKDPQSSSVWIICLFVNLSFSVRLLVCNSILHKEQYAQDNDMFTELQLRFKCLQICQVLRLKGEIHFFQGDIMKTLNLLHIFIS